MKQEQFATIQPQSVIPLPPRTRAILEQKAAERLRLQSLMQAEERGINDVIAAAREMLGVPDGWSIRNTDEGFTAPAGVEQAAVVVEPASLPVTVEAEEVEPVA